VHLCLVYCAVIAKQPHQRTVRDDVATGVGGRTQQSTVEVRGTVRLQSGSAGLVEQSDAQLGQHRGVSGQQQHNVEFGEQIAAWETSAERQLRSAHS